MRGRIRCPACRGERFVDLGSGWAECVSDVPYSGAPPELTGLPHPIHQFGPCGHRFQPARVLEANAARHKQAEQEARERAEAQAAELALRDKSIAILKQSNDISTILEALTIREGLIPAEILKATWLGLIDRGEFETPDEEIVTLEGRGTLLGYVLSRGTYTTQWGQWTEQGREPVFKATGAGRRVSPRLGEIPESVTEGFDVWLDESGEIWSSGDQDNSHACLSLGGWRGTERLIVGRGTQLNFRRRKAEWMGWETLVPKTRNAWHLNPGDIEYQRALKAVLAVA